MTRSTLWLASYPRSGNTWMRALLDAWQTGEVHLNALPGEAVSARVRFDDALGILSSSLTAGEIELLRPRVDDLHASESGGLTIRKIHDGYYRGPTGEPIVSAAATRGAIYLVRDPRDVAVSLAAFSGRDGEWAAGRLIDPEAVTGDSVDSLELQLRQRLGTWSQHVLSWLELAPFPVHVIRYEDLVVHPLRTFGEALQFAGLEPMDGASLEAAIDHTRFTRLRGAEEREGFRERPRRAPHFFRSGRVGAWHEELSQAAAARIVEAHAPVMARFDYL